MFKEVPRGVEKDSEELIEDKMQELKKVVATELERIRTDVASICRQITGNVEETKQLCADLERLVRPAQEMMAGPVRDLLDECQKGAHTAKGVKKEATAEYAISV